jgi:uncharacterized protein YggE
MLGPVALVTLALLSSSLIGVHSAAASPRVTTEQSLDSVLVTGTGEVSGEPDSLIANFAVETSAASVDAALESANTAAAKMRDALVRGGIARADLQTADVGIRPRQNEKQEITGYFASQSLTANIRNLPRAGSLLTAAIKAGGDAVRLNGVSFTIENRAALLDEARKKAFSDARGRADLYARQAGRTLGRVVKVSEETASFGGPVAHYSMAADSAVPIEPGRQRLTVSVTVEWAFQPATETATVAAADGYQSEIRTIDTATAKTMIGVSWRKGCPVPLSDLRRVQLTHWGFDGASHRGELIVHKDVARSVVAVFHTMYAARFPIRKMQRVDRYRADDNASMAADNTSAFNCRPITGSTSGFSVHSYGKAIDINTVENPYVKGATVQPAAGQAFTNRANLRPGMIRRGDRVWRAFTAHGFTWGGDWQSLKDYQHFEAPI